MFEILIVVTIIGIMASIGIPSIVHSMHKAGMRKAVSDFVEACSHARAAAIFSGKITALVIHPKEKTFSTTGFQEKFPEGIEIAILGVNFIELQEAESATVRFYPNGTTEEFAMVIQSDQHETRKITLDVVTGFADVEGIE